ncbi:hypothetical protein [Roseivivax isoporae]|uniref:Membrane protein n=1 Tax=Roseivivax isoporae LMG 25204 TaxID=1449351 RepID=X7FC54_9RHOB|nr:hypothetical protein [Roseivivax isoporae]ETX30487.1 membrane protein [Roseivivax isoporae LMG 25204]
MAEAGPVRLWWMRGVYLALCLAVMFFHLLPLDFTPRALAGPDVILAFTFAWAVRRPDYVPALSVALAMLLADLVFQRPPGLWAALALVVVERFKTRERRSRDTAFAVEWASVAAALIVMALIYQIVLLVLIVPTANGTLLLSQTAATILVYPVVAAVTRVVFGLRRTGRPEGDRLGLGTGRAG